MAEIRAVKDEDIMCLGDGFRKSSAEVVEKTASSLDNSTKIHDDAIFAPPGASLSQDSNDTASTRISPQVASTRARLGLTGAVGAAARARLALTGKRVETPKPKTRAIPTGTARVKTDERSLGVEDQVAQPLFKTLQVC